MEWIIYAFAALILAGIVYFIGSLISDFRKASQGGRYVAASAEDMQMLNLHPDWISIKAKVTDLDTLDLSKMLPGKFKSGNFTADAQGVLRDQSQAKVATVDFQFEGKNTTAVIMLAGRRINIGDEIQIKYNPAEPREAVLAE